MSKLPSHSLTLYGALEAALRHVVAATARDTETTIAPVPTLFGQPLKLMAR